MKIFAAAIAAISVLAAGCATSTMNPGAPTPEEKWIPLTKGAILSFDANYEYADMKLQNGKFIPRNKWNGYLKDYVESFPLEKRQAILDGITRYYTRHDETEGSILFEPVRYLSEPYARASYIALIGTLRPERAIALAELNYYEDSWVFARRFKVLVDGVAFESPVLKFRRGNHGGKAWERTYLDLSKKEYRDLIERIISSNEAIIRFQGEKYYSDMKVTERMREDMGAMLEAIDAINGARAVQTNLKSVRRLPVPSDQNRLSDTFATPVP